MRIRHLLSLFLLISVAVTTKAQLSYGGKPLPFAGSLLRSSGNFYVDMPSFDAGLMLKEDSINERTEVRKIRFAKKFETNITPDNAGIRFTTEDGTNVWRVGIRSKGAYTINVLFTEYNVPEGARLFLYNSDQSSISGAFTEKNNSDDRLFPVAPVPGDELIIEYHEPVDAVFQGSLVIGEVNHDYANILKKRPNTPGDAGGCHQDPICRTDLDNETQAVCMLVINGTEFCSGSLLNNTAQDGTPYLLTSCHCINGYGKPNEDIVKTIVVFFNYQSPACNSQIRGSEEMSMVSPELKASDKNIDFALLQLDQIPPRDFRPYYVGWNISSTPESSYTCIHQPNGGIKKVAQSDGAIDMKTGYRIGNTTFDELWWIKRWSIGTTEGGSSGSPLFDSQKRVIGALTGGSSTCSSPANDYYWTLKRGWDTYPEAERQLKIWLDPLDTGNTSLDGYNPYGSDSCLKISNLTRNEPYKNYSLNEPESGVMFGYNSLQTDEYAEKFELTHDAFLYGVSLVTPALSGPRENKNIYVNIYVDDEIVASKEFLPQYTDYTAPKGHYDVNKPYNYAGESYLRFDEPIPVKRSFMVSYKLDYSVNNSFSVYNATARSTGTNTAYYKYQGIWTPISSHVNYPMNTSLWINPVIKYVSESSVNQPEWHKNTTFVFGEGNGIFKITGNAPFDNAKVNVYSLSGKIVRSFSFSGVEHTFELNDQAQGMYIITLQSRSGNILLREKIIR